jgi:hypothetical protein
MFCALQGEVAATGRGGVAGASTTSANSGSKRSERPPTTNGRASGQVLQDAQETMSTVIE